MADPRLELLSRKLIKPSSATPNQLRYYKLSFMDQLMHRKYMPFALFYPNECHYHYQDPSQISFLLEKSLSNLLSFYYPFAGRLTDNISINCNDMGATFLEARINCPMSDILEGPNYYTCVKNAIFPSGLPWTDAKEEDSLLVVQLSHFSCGGKALSICMSHKLCDTYGICNFLMDWASMVSQSGEKPCPQFVGTSVFTPPEDPITSPAYDFVNEQYVVKRFKFNAFTLDYLKATIAADSEVQNPTRVEVVTALLYKCAVTASLKVNSQSFKPSVILLPVNLRALTMPPLPASSIGNFIFMLSILITDEGEMNLPRLVSRLRKEKLQHYEKYKTMKQNELFSAALEEKEKFLRNEYYAYKFTSLCKFPFYNFDFGWGRPTRLGITAFPSKSSFVLTDDPNEDGVEVTVALDEQVMSLFQIDKDILEFASLDTTF